MMRLTHKRINGKRKRGGGVQNQAEADPVSGPRYRVLSQQVLAECVGNTMPLKEGHCVFAKNGLSRRLPSCYSSDSFSPIGNPMDSVSGDREVPKNTPENTQEPNINTRLGVVDWVSCIGRSGLSVLATIAFAYSVVHTDVWVRLFEAVRWVGDGAFGWIRDHPWVSVPVFLFFTLTFFCAACKSANRSTQEKHLLTATVVFGVMLVSLIFDLLIQKTSSPKAERTCSRTETEVRTYLPSGGTKMVRYGKCGGVVAMEVRIPMPKP